MPSDSDPPAPIAAERLWHKGDDPDDIVLRFTVGDDPHWDRQLAYWDCLGSAAHARTLERAGLLTPTESGLLVAELDRIARRARGAVANEQFEIPPELEDCHTAIEHRLTVALGDVGRKIHTGRSRNDQVVTAMRLFLREETLRVGERVAAFADACAARIDADGSLPMPGFTHLRPAMPSSVGLWLAAFAEAALDALRSALQLLDRLDACPLGTGAGFGVPLPLDRAFTARLLGFSRVQRNPIDVQNSRGRLESAFVRLAADAGGVVEKLSWDLILYSMPQFGYLGLPDEMTTGSSIMPQKRNPDVIELLRGRAAPLRAALVELEGVACKLPSSYHRDLQLTKSPVFRAAANIAEMLAVAARVVARVTVNADALRAAMTPELYATAAAYELVRSGTPFRDAYQVIARQIRDGSFVAPADVGSAGQAPESDLAALRAELIAARSALRTQRERVDAALSRLLPSP